MKKTTSRKKVSSSQEGSDFLKLAQPAQRALAAAGVEHLEQLTRFTEAEVKHWHGIGPNAFAQLHRTLREKGLSFAAVQTRDKP